MTTWVLSTDHYRARCFDYDARLSTLLEISDLINPAVPESVDDQRGSASNGTGGHHGMQSRTTPREHDTRLFAQAIARFLRDKHAAGQFDELQLVAAPDWLGELRQTLSPTVQRTLAEPLQKNLAKASRDELLQQLKHHAWH